MNEMFTEAARKAIEYARDEAARLKHDYIGTEHLLLGLIRLGEGNAVDVINNLGMELTDLKNSIEEVVQPSGGTMTMGQLPLTARAKKTLEVSGQEARALKSKDIDTEHILLALLKDEEGASMVEYAIGVGFIAAILIVVVLAMSDALGDRFDGLTDTIEEATAAS